LIARKGAGTSSSIALRPLVELQLDLTARSVRIGGRLFSEGDTSCLDAESGLIFAGAPGVIEERPNEELQEVAPWRDAHPIATSPV